MTGSPENLINDVLKSSKSIGINLKTKSESSH